MITGINESEILAKHVSCKCKRKFDGQKYNSNQNRVDVSAKIQENIVCAKILFGISVQVLVKMVNIQKVLFMIH